MKKIAHILFFLITVFSNRNSAFASGFDELTISLMPLDSVLAKAELRSPVLKMHDVLIRKSEEDEMRARKMWLNSLKFSANIRTGSYGNPTIDQVETGYTYGPAFSISLYELFSQKNQNKIFEAEKQSIEYKKEQASIELRSYIIKVYNEILLCSSVLKIYSESVSSSIAHMQMAEREFSDGSIQVSELSRVSEINSKLRVEFETNASLMKTKLMELSQLTGLSVSELTQSK